MCLNAWTQCYCLWHNVPFSMLKPFSYTNVNVYMKWIHTYYVIDSDWTFIDWATVCCVSFSFKPISPPNIAISAWQFEGNRFCFPQIMMIINATDSINSHRYKKNQASTAIVVKNTIEFNVLSIYKRNISISQFLCSH